MTDHVIRVRDLRSRYGDVETFRAECVCGWKGAAHSGRTAERTALHEGTRHVEDERPPRTPNG